MIHHTPLLPLPGELIPSSPARLMFAHMSLWIVAIEKKTKWEKEKERKYNRASIQYFAIACRFFWFDAHRRPPT